MLNIFNCNFNTQYIEGQRHDICLKMQQSIYIVYRPIWIHVGEQFSNDGVYSCEPPDDDRFGRNM
jgi:hypothetical protein